MSAQGNTHGTSPRQALRAPVVVTVFNRPDLVRRVFAEIARAQPRDLFIIADAPRKNRSGEAEKCAAALAVVDQIDWECEVFRNYSDVNLGPSRRIYTGIDWAFQHVEEAIILEHDCLPHPSFFRYCDELLDRYRDDERIMNISGNNFQFGLPRTRYSYYFSRYNHIWGWATWRRAWRHYDPQMALWPELRSTSWLMDLLGEREAVRYWRKVLDLTFTGQINTWDTQWMFACWAQNGMAVTPNVNLVSNIGFGPEAAHTGNINSPLNQVPLQEMVFPLRHPPSYVVRHKAADDFAFKKVCRARTSLGGMLRRAGHFVVPRPLRPIVSRALARFHPVGPA